MSGKSYVIIDGELILEDSSTQLNFNGRSVKYGDGFFETIHYHHSKALFLHLHAQRMIKTAKLLKFDFPAHWMPTFFDDQIQKLAAANHVNNGRINIVFTRDTEGFYLPLDKKFRYQISLTPAADKEEVYILNETGLKLGEYRELIKTSNYLSSLKTNNGLIYVMAALYAKANQLDECLIFNDVGRVAEAVSSNIILVKNDTLITPPFSEYGIDGVMKKVLFQKASAYGYKVEEYPIYPEDLYSCDEVWLTNVMKGIQWVGDYRGKSFGNSVATNIISLLNNSL
jgi:branched-chain amino acid aminotransferase